MNTKIFIYKKIQSRNNPISKSSNFVKKKSSCSLEKRFVLAAESGHSRSK